VAFFLQNLLLNETEVTDSERPEIFLIKKAGIWCEPLVTIIPYDVYKKVDADHATLVYPLSVDLIQTCPLVPHNIDLLLLCCKDWYTARTN